MKFQLPNIYLEKRSARLAEAVLQGIPTCMFSRVIQGSETIYVYEFGVQGAPRISFQGKSWEEAIAKAENVFLPDTPAAFIPDGPSATVGSTSQQNSQQASSPSPFDLIDPFVNRDGVKIEAGQTWESMDPRRQFQCTVLGTLLDHGIPKVLLQGPRRKTHVRIADFHPHSRGWKQVI